MRAIDDLLLSRAGGQVLVHCTEFKCKFGKGSREQEGGRAGSGQCRIESATGMSTSVGLLTLRAPTHIKTWHEMAVKRDAKQIPKGWPGQQNLGSGTTDGKFVPTVWHGTGGAKQPKRTTTGKEGASGIPLKVLEMFPSRSEVPRSGIAGIHSRTSACTRARRITGVPPSCKVEDTFLG